jgi:signal transduction histidine kinase
MSLSTRLSAFFLTSMALVLIGFSGTLYLLARTYLVRQLDDRLQRCLDTLEAAVDIEPGGLEWEPEDRLIAVGVDTGINALRWAVRDGRGALVDLSPNARDVGFPAHWEPTPGRSEPPDGTTFGRSPGWRMASRRLELGGLLRQGRGHPDDEPGYEVQYPVLVLVAGLSPAPTEAALGRLGLTLTVLSLGIWALAAMMNRWLARRALAPLRQMALSAAAMTAAELGRLPIPGTGDELDDLGRVFNELLDRLDDALDRQRRFAGDASHQLCNPLTALLGQVQLARRRDRSPVEYRQVLDRVLDEGTRLRQIVESLLMLADPGGTQVELEVVDLARWLPEHLGRWSGHPRAGDLGVVIDGDGPLTVRAHPPLLGQLVDNLLDNALKYSPSGSPVVIRAGRDGDAVVLGVEDRGCGLGAGERELVFEPFYRAAGVRRASPAGAGLGLAVARRIADALAGTLGVAGVPGGGSLFMLRLPFYCDVPNPHRVKSTGAEVALSRNMNRLCPEQDSNLQPRV